MTNAIDEGWQWNGHLLNREAKPSEETTLVPVVNVSDLQQERHILLEEGGSEHVGVT
jgi:hypothetical protein